MTIVAFAIASLVLGSTNSDKTTITYHGRLYYENIHSLFVSVDAGPNGAAEFRNSTEALALQFRLGDGDCTKLWGVEAGSDGIRSELKALARRSTDKDRVIVDLVGHGHMGTDGTVSFVASDAAANPQDGDKGLLPMKEVLALFNAVPALHKWLILDACYAGSLHSELAVGPTNPDLMTVRDRPGAVVWLGSYADKRTTFDEYGLTSLHKAITIAAQKPLFQQDLEDFQYRVGRENAPLIAGSLGRLHGQMYLGPRATQTSSGGQDALESRYEKYDSAAVKKAVKEMEDVLQEPGLTDTERARLQVECAKAHGSWQVPSEIKEHSDRAIKLLGIARDVLDGGERCEATVELAAALWNSPDAERRKRLKRAIDLYIEALTCFTGEGEQLKRAHIMNDLGNAYSGIPTDRPANLIRAIECYDAALQVYTRKAFPIDWAKIQNNRGNTYQQIPTDRSANLSRAIDCHKAALEVRTRKAYPIEWAASQNNLGNTYQRMPTNRPKNLTLAVECYKAALKVRNEEEHPVDWATTQNNLGAAYRNMPMDQTANLGLAIGCYKAALRVRTLQALPVEYATTQCNLGIAYWYIPTKLPKNLNLAVTCYNEALKVWTEEAFDVDWAATQNNLGLVYADMPTENPGNLARAIECYRAALRIRTFETLPEEWASTQNNLGNVFSIIPTDRPSNLDRAVICYREALRVQTQKALPEPWCITSFNLALALEDLGKNKEALAIHINVEQFARDIGYETAAAGSAEAIKRIKGGTNCRYGYHMLNWPYSSPDRTLIEAMTSWSLATASLHNSSMVVLIVLFAMVLGNGTRTSINYPTTKNVQSLDSLSVKHIHTTKMGD